MLSILGTLLLTGPTKVILWSDQPVRLDGIAEHAYPVVCDDAWCTAVLQGEEVREGEGSCRSVEPARVLDLLASTWVCCRGEVEV